MEDIRRFFHHKSVETTKRSIHRTDERTTEIASRVSDQVTKIMNAKKPPLVVVATKMDRPGTGDRHI